jgi:hypothetical protein
MPDYRTPPRAVLLVAALIIAAAAWYLLRSFIGDTARECNALYRAARSAADTVRVDSTVTPGSAGRSDPRTCGSIRTSARWR